MRRIVDTPLSPPGTRPPLRHRRYRLFLQDTAAVSVGGGGGVQSRRNRFYGNQCSGL